MGIPKHKNNINIHSSKELTERREEMLNEIIKSDTYLPEGIEHDDLDRGMLDFVKKNFIVVYDGRQIPILPKILTVQRWGEIASNWQYTDNDKNIKVPFIGVIRKPDVQPGTNPVAIKNVPDKKLFYYNAVPTFDGNQRGMDIYKIPQPVVVDIKYDVKIICQTIRELNQLNKIILNEFASIQAYTKVKGHYIPIKLESVSDNTSMDMMDGRRFYVQTYTFILMGFIIDSDKFEVVPAINRAILTQEISDEPTPRRIINKMIDLTTVTFVGDGVATTFIVDEPIATLFFVSINGLVQKLNEQYYHMEGTSRITFIVPPQNGANIMVVYYRGEITNPDGGIYYLKYENFTYDGSSLIFTTTGEIADVMYVDINGLVDLYGTTYTYDGVNKTVTLLEAPIVGSTVDVAYLEYTYLTGTTLNRHVRSRFVGVHHIQHESFIYDGSSLTFTTSLAFSDILEMDINGLTDVVNSSYHYVGSNSEFTLLFTPIIGSIINVAYIYYIP